MEATKGKRGQDFTPDLKVMPGTLAYGSLRDGAASTPNEALAAYYERE